MVVRSLLAATLVLLVACTGGAVPMTQTLVLHVRGHPQRTSAGRYIFVIRADVSGPPIRPAAAAQSI
ncbi:MAG TPA: hypothetical protein VGB19_05975 [Actinomycetota bacterium]